MTSEAKNPELKKLTSKTFTIGKGVSRKETNANQNFSYGLLSPMTLMALGLVPSDDQLVVEAMVLPKDIGFVKIGQSIMASIQPQIDIITGKKLFCNSCQNRWLA